MSIIQASSSVSVSNKGMFAIPVFDGTKEKWFLWRQRVKAAMVGRGWWKYIEPPTVVTSASSTKELPSDSIDQSALALAALTLSLPDDLMSAYASEEVTDPSILWKKLCDHFESTSMMNKTHLRSKLSNHHMTPSMTYLAYYTELMTIVRSLKGMKEMVSDSEVLHHLLNGLAPAFQMVKLLLQTNDRTTPETAHQMLTQHAERMSLEQAQSTSSMTDTNELFYVSRGGFGRPNFNRGQGGARNNSGCFTCGSHDHRAFDCPKNTTKKKCNFCRHVGSHTEIECRKKKAAAASTKGNSLGATGGKKSPGASANIVIHDTNVKPPSHVYEDSEDGEELF